MARVMGALVLLAAMCLTAHCATEEVEILEPHTEEHLMAQADEILREHSELEMLGLKEGSPGVLHLTKKIKSLQTDIKSIRAKKAKHNGKAAGAKSAARAAGKGGKRDNHMRSHIENGAAAKDLDAQLRKKNHQLASLTIQQHDAAKGAGPAPAPPADPPVDTTPAEPAPGPDAKGLFDGWLSGKWSPMHSALSSAIAKLRLHLGPLKAEAAKHDTEVKGHIKKVKEAYNKQERGRKAWKAKETSEKAREKAAKASEKKAKAQEANTKKVMKERLAKAAEKKAKAVKAEEMRTKVQERLAKKYERKIKAVKPPKKCEDCGPFKEQERKAKEKLAKAIAHEKKTKSDCERKAKEAAAKLKKSQEQTAKQKARADRLARELAAARKLIASLKKQLAAAKAKIAQLEKVVAAQKREIAKQIRLKKQWMAKFKVADEKRAKAEAKVVQLTKQLAIVTAKYNKVKGVMKHINTVSNGPHERK